MSLLSQLRQWLRGQLVRYWPDRFSRREQVYRANNERRNELFRQTLREQGDVAVLELLTDARNLLPDPCDPDWAYEWINEYPDMYYNGQGPLYLRASIPGFPDLSRLHDDEQSGVFETLVQYGHVDCTRRFLQQVDDVTRLGVSYQDLIKKALSAVEPTECELAIVELLIDEYPNRITRVPQGVVRAARTWPATNEGDVFQKYHDTIVPCIARMLLERELPYEHSGYNRNDPRPRRLLSGLFDRPQNKLLNKECAYMLQLMRVLVSADIRYAPPASSPAELRPVFQQMSDQPNHPATEPLAEQLLRHRRLPPREQLQSFQDEKPDFFAILKPYLPGRVRRTLR